MIQDAIDPRSPVELGKSEQFSDYLYRFVKRPDYLVQILELRAFPPRYSIEDVEYLVPGSFTKLSIAMVCFCDIPEKRLENHASGNRYGEYGIKLTKTWGIRSRIQPVQYMNPESPLAKEFSRVFKIALATRRASDTEFNALKSNLVNQILFCKPLYDEGTEFATSLQCMEDECEWRYVPDSLGSFPKLVPHALPAEELDAFNNAIRNDKLGILTFDLHNDFTSLIVATDDARQNLIEAIEESSILPDDDKAFYCKSIHVRGR